MRKEKVCCKYIFIFIFIFYFFYFFFFFFFFFLFFFLLFFFFVLFCSETNSVVLSAAEFASVQEQLNSLKTALYESRAKEQKLQSLGLQWKQKVFFCFFFLFFLFFFIFLLFLFFLFFIFLFFYFIFFIFYFFDNLLFFCCSVQSVGRRVSKGQIRHCGLKKCQRRREIAKGPCRGPRSSQTSPQLQCRKPTAVRPVSSCCCCLSCRKPTTARSRSRKKKKKEKKRNIFIFFFFFFRRRCFCDY